MNKLATAKCTRCNASATGKTFDEASSLIDHARGLSRGIPCGDNYNCVVEISTDTKLNIPKPTAQTSTPSSIPKPPQSKPKPTPSKSNKK